MVTTKYIKLYMSRQEGLGTEGWLIFTGTKLMIGLKGLNQYSFILYFEHSAHFQWHNYYEWSVIS